MPDLNGLLPNLLRPCILAWPIFLPASEEASIYGRVLRMYDLFLATLKVAYGAGGIITFVGFFPTVRDLWKGKPSANVSTYVVWSTTTFLTLL